MKSPVTIHHLGLCDYLPIWQRMHDFTCGRQATTVDQIWLLQHHPVFTQGTSCHAKPHPHRADIPLLHTDRGGQITYHGPGQLIAYLLLNLKHRQLTPKSLIHQVEQSVLNLLDGYAISASRRCGAPGVYVQQAKIAALGLRIKRGCCFHGLSLNVDMELAPYARIDPCGYPNLAVTQIREHLSPPPPIREVEEQLAQRLLELFG